MHEFSTFDAKNKFSALLDLVEKGEEVVVTRHGKRIARLVPEKATQPLPTQEDAKRAVEGFRQLAKNVRLDGLSIKELIEEGRR